MRGSKLVFGGALALALMAAGAVRAEVDAEMRADIERLMALTGEKEMGEQIGRLVAEQMVAAMLKADPSFSPRAAEITRDVMKQGFAEGVRDENLLDDIVEIYARHYTRAEIRGLIDFYQSELGQKVAQSMPAVSVESVGVGQRFSERMIPTLHKELMRRLRAEGLEP